MKIVKLLLTLTMVITVISGCKKTPEDLLVGKWKLSDIRTNLQLSEEEKKSYFASMRELVENTYYDLKSDKSYHAMINGVEYTGKWRVNETGDLLFFTDDTGGETKTTIKSLNDKEMITLSEDGTTLLVFKKE